MLVLLSWLIVATTLPRVMLLLTLVLIFQLAIVRVRMFTSMLLLMLIMNYNLWLAWTAQLRLVIPLPTLVRSVASTVFVLLLAPSQIMHWLVMLPVMFCLQVDGTCCSVHCQSQRVWYMMSIPMSGLIFTWLLITVLMVCRVSMVPLLLTVLALRSSTGISLTNISGMLRSACRSSMNL